MRETQANEDGNVMPGPWREIVSKGQDFCCWETHFHPGPFPSSQTKETTKQK